MAELGITSEVGMFHSACRCTFGTSVEWYGFGPVQHRSPRGPGEVSSKDRGIYINHMITFVVDDTTLQEAISYCVNEYKNKTYSVGYLDCVSFSADMARQAGLGVPLINMTPWGLIQALRMANAYKAIT